MICPNCDKEITEDSTFCPWCRFEIKPSSVEQAPAALEAGSKSFSSIFFIFGIAAIVVILIIISTSVNDDKKNIPRQVIKQSTNIHPPSKKSIRKIRKKMNNFRNADRWGIKPPCYIICSSACRTQKEARKRENSLNRKGYSTGFIWVPDYKSLSGAKFYVVFIGPYSSRSLCVRKLREYQRINKKAYAVLVSHEKGRDEIR